MSPIVPFSTYTLNNDNAECWYILVFDCTLGNFVFMNPCDLIDGCHINVNNLIDWNTFDWCQIVNSPGVVGMLPGYILRVNMTGTCIEGVQLSSIITPGILDYMVKVTASDTPDYLWAKIVGVPGRTIVSIIPGQYVQIDVDNTLIDGILPADPVCDLTQNPTWYAQLVYDITSWVHRECQENRSDAYRYQRYLQNDITYSTGDPTWAFPAGWFIWQSCYRFVRALGGDGLQSMQYNFIPAVWDGFSWPMLGQNVPAIMIQESGLYAVRANVDREITSNIAVDSAIEAIRFFIYSNNNKTILLNSKEADQPLSLCPIGVTTTTRTFSWYNQVYLQKWEYLFLGFRVFTPDPTKTFTLTVISEARQLDSPYPSTAAGKLSGTSFGCALVSKSTLNAS